MLLSVSAALFMPSNEQAAGPDFGCFSTTTTEFTLKLYSDSHISLNLFSFEEWAFLCCVPEPLDWA